MFEVGDRVKIRKEKVASFSAPWKARFKSGRRGTILRAPGGGKHGWLVGWDHGWTKTPSAWTLRVNFEDLVISS